jgi:hypothetical protein
VQDFSRNPCFCQIKQTTWYSRTWNTNAWTRTFPTARLAGIVSAPAHFKSQGYLVRAAQAKLTYDRGIGSNATEGQGRLLMGQLAGAKSRGLHYIPANDTCGDAPNGRPTLTRYHMSTQDCGHARLLRHGALPRGRRRHHSGEAGVRFLPGISGFRQRLLSF